MYNSFAKILNSYAELTSTEQQAILSKLKPLSVAKNEFLVVKGDVSRYFYYLHSGCVRNFSIQDNGQESTRCIAFEQSFVGNLSSFLSQQPSEEFLQALEDSKFLMLHKSDFDTLLQESRVFERIYRQQLERTWLTNNWRLDSFLSMPAKKRYEHLIKTDPQIISRLSNKIVASYLGITQESLSRLKTGK
jgi:CRP-like cAMP-binding protein